MLASVSFWPLLIIESVARVSQHVLFTHDLLINTPYNVGSVLRRLFSTVGDSISTAEAVQYCGGIASVRRGIASVLRRNSISTAEAVQYCGGIAAVHVGG